MDRAVERSHEVAPGDVAVAAVPAGPGAGDLVAAQAAMELGEPVPRRAGAGVVGDVQVVVEAGARIRTMGIDLECCSSMQSFESFARGEGVWRGFPIAHRRDQLRQIADVGDELYPMFRWFLFDGLERYAVPVTIFGPIRASVYLGQMYLVLTSADHVRTLTSHFDDLIRGAVVQPPQVPELARRLLAELEAG